jgi:hypothetical protein
MSFMGAVLIDGPNAVGKTVTASREFIVGRGEIPDPSELRSEIRRL